MVPDKGPLNVCVCVCVCMFLSSLRALAADIADDADDVSKLAFGE